MYDNVRYKKDFLKEVIIRFDFSSSITELESNLPQKIENSAKKKFPISEPQEAFTKELKFSHTAPVQEESKKSKIWNFHGKEREKSLIITPTSFAVSIRKYKTYEALKEDVSETAKVFFDVFPDLRVNRAGLRYVNVLSIDQATPLVWKKYINGNLLKNIDFREKEFLSRAFCILEYNFDEYSIKYQLGIANPDYPAIIRRKEFVLDLDAYSIGTLDWNDTSSFLDKAHIKIQDFFENSITSSTRKLMKQVGNEK